MDDQFTNTIAWDEAWDAALQRYDDLAKNDFAFLIPMRSLVTQLRTAEDLRGLFAITSHATLIISPYSCYPDWFEGRRVVVEAISERKVRATYLRNGWDAKPEIAELNYVEGLAKILDLCRTRL